MTVNNEAIPRFVVKETSPQEITALERFEQAGVDGVARIAAVDSSAGRPLLMMPWYSGVHGDFGAMPRAAIEALAHIHSLSAVSGFGGIGPLSFDALSGWAFGDMSIYPGDLHGKALALRDAMPDFEALSAELPRSIIHWDIHPENLLIQGGEAVIIDWENACIAPPLLDLTNMLAWESDGFRSYLESFGQRSRKAQASQLKRREYDWCVAMTQVRYMFVPARAGKKEAATRMADVALRYLEEAV